MILNFIMGFVFGVTLSLILLLIVAWNITQEKKGGNAPTYDNNESANCSDNRRKEQE